MASEGEDVYCTLLTNDAYLPGAAVLAHSLRDGGTTKKLAVLITKETVSDDAVAKVKELYDYVIPVERIANPNPANLYFMGRPDLIYTFTKINLWRQTQFRKIVYLDADVVALRAPDELFDIQAPFAAAPDIGWPDAFNTGVMVLSPNTDDFAALQALASSGESFDGADQGLLNQYYEKKDWHRLSFTYNCTPNAEYQWEPAYRYHKSNIKMVHFIGKDKPWIRGRQGPAGSGVYGELFSKWWAVYDRHFDSSTSQYQLAGTAHQGASSSGVPPYTGPGAAGSTGNQGSSGNDKPAAVFPWEKEGGRPAATRVFQDEFHPTGAPSDDSEPFAAQSNAWDNVAGIDRYVQAVKGAQTRRKTPPQSEDPASPSDRPESLILTEFPSADDRPSLPVTPAPVRPTTFWGGDETGELPAAEGVPDQADWVGKGSSKGSS